MLLTHLVTPTACMLHLLQAKLLFTDQGTRYDHTGGARDPSTSAVPNWLSDWRLKLALGSWQLYQELWMELSGAAAACYTRCGRKRNGALMMADIADALMARGNVARTAVVLQRQCRLFLKEGWWELAAAVLPRLLQCQKMLMQVLLLVMCSVCKSCSLTVPLLTYPLAPGCTESPPHRLVLCIASR